MPDDVRRVHTSRMPGESQNPKPRSSAPIPITPQRALMDLARVHAERDYDRPPRPLWPTLVGAVLALGVVFVVGRGFDSFLGGFQRLLERIAREDAAIEARKPQPVYAVPEGTPAEPAELPPEEPP